MIEIESTTVRLGEKEFIVKTAGFLRSKPWKKRLFEDIKPLFDKLGGLTDIEFNSPADLLGLMPIIENLFVEGIDSIFELLITYSAVLEEEKEYISNNASDKQIIGAFQEVVLLADPFGLVMQMNRKLGLAAIGTL